VGVIHAMNHVYKCHKLEGGKIKNDGEVDDGIKNITERGFGICRDPDAELVGKKGYNTIFLMHYLNYRP
jgi:hypothetical protein